MGSEKPKRKGYGGEMRKEANAYGNRYGYADVPRFNQKEIVESSN